MVGNKRGFAVFAGSQPAAKLVYTETVFLPQSLSLPTINRCSQFKEMYRPEIG